MNALQGKIHKAKKREPKRSIDIVQIQNCSVVLKEESNGEIRRNAVAMLIS